MSSDNASCRAVARYGRVLVVVLCLCMMPSAPAESSTRHALLIGVSEYPRLPARHHLQGPANDVRLMRAILPEHGFAPERIAVLADGVENSGALPTGAAIRKAFAALIEAVGEGDFVYLHFSGHGAQQPVTEATAAGEPDGLDELFLPRDTGRWDPATRRIENALLDDEIGVFIQALNDRGAFVWAVFDTCHAATLTRAHPEAHWRVRRVSMDDLGVPQAARERHRRYRGTAPDERPRRVADRFDASAAEARFVAFFGSHSNQEAPELNLPSGQRPPVVQGLLTYTLASALQTLPPGVSYRRLGEFLVADYAANRLTATVPLFEGTALDAAVFERAPGERVHQWPIEPTAHGYRIPAGRLQRIDEGALFGVVASPLDDAVLGYLRAERVAALSAYLVPDAPDPQQAPITHEAIPADGFARLLATRPRLSLRVAPPPPASAMASGEPYTPVEREALAALHALRRAAQTTESASEPSLSIDWVEPTGEADVVLRLADERLWLLDPGAALITEGPQRSPSIQADDHEAIGGLIDTHLLPIARVHNLLRLAARLGPENATDELSLSLTLSGKGPGETHFRPLPYRSIRTFNPGDELQLSVTNTGTHPLDITILFVDSRYGIHPLYPRGGRLNRRSPTEAATIEGRITDSTTGLERIIVIAARAPPGIAVSDFTYLAQSTLPAATADDTRRGAADRAPAADPSALRAVHGLLTEAVFGHPPRELRGTPRPARQTVLMAVLQWYVVP